MADFLTAFKRRLPIEGGWENDATDSGCWTLGDTLGAGHGVNIGTNMGVCAYELSAYLGRTATESDMKNLSSATAAAIFKKNYWDKFRGDEIINQNIANDIYDATVNQGLITGIKQAQRAAGLPVTGSMDNTTLNYLNTLL
jgi:lysozyme family protein